MSRKTTLAELMGSSASDRGKKGLSLEQLPEILGDAMPHLPRNPVGRYRLLRALQQRYGPNFRTLPGIKDLLKQFDNEHNYEMKLAEIGSIKMPKRESK